MKNNGQPIRDSVPWNFWCTKDPHWLNKIFLFGTEIWADQLKNNPVWLFVCYIEVSDIINIEGARYYIDVIVLFLPLICFEDIFLIEHFIPYLDMFLRTFFIPWFLFVTFICFCRCQLAWCQLRTKVAVVRNWLVCFNLRENFWWITKPTRASLI